MVKTNLLAMAGLSIFSNALLSSAVCSRPVLQAALDNLLKTIEKSSAPSVTLASMVKITKNNAPVMSIAETGFKNFTRWAKPFRITVLDETTCNVAAMSVPKYRNNTQILSTRMQVTPAGEATELEVFFTGRDTNPVFFGDYLPDSPGAMWSAKNPAPRADLLKSMDAYASGITSGNGNMVKVAPDCSRYENGFRIGAKLPKGQIGLGFGGCNTGFALIKVPVVDRRWYVDSETGVGLGNFMFSSAMWLHEYFKVQDGKIMQIYAGMQNGPLVPKDPWSPPKVE
jgi:hypothetical protein